MKSLSAYMFVSAAVLLSAPIALAEDAAVVSADVVSFLMWTAGDGEERSFDALDAASLPPIVSDGAAVTSTSPKGEEYALAEHPEDVSAVAWSPAPDRGGIWKIEKGAALAQFRVALALDTDHFNDVIGAAGAYKDRIADAHEDSASLLEKSLSDALVVLNDENASQDEINEASAALEKSFAEVTDVVNRTEFAWHLADAAEIVGSIALPGDNRRCQQLIADADVALGALAYDDTVSLEDNLAAVDAVMNSLVEALAFERADNPLVPVTHGEGVVDASRSQTYDAYVLDGDGVLWGTAQVRVGRANRKTRLANVTAVLNPVVGSRMSFRASEKKGKATIPEDAAAVVGLAYKGQPMTLKIGTEGVFGKWGDLMVKGIRARAKANKSSYAAWTGLKTVAFASNGGHSVFAFRVKSKGSVKGSGSTVKGSRVSSSSQLLLAEGGAFACVPVVHSKSPQFGFLMWLKRDETLGESGAGDVEGVLCGDVLSNDWVSGAAGVPVRAMTFVAGDVSVGVEWNGRKMLTPKADKVALVDGQIVSIVDNGNKPGLSLFCNAETGEFSGSYSVYQTVGGKLKRKRAVVRGVFVDGTGYGTAIVKGVGRVPVKIK